MKKIFYIFLALNMFWCGLRAQKEPLPDGGFSEWKVGHTDAQYGGDEFDDLSNEFWNTLNMLSTLPPDMFTGPVTVFKDKGRSGADNDYAPRMTSKSMSYGQGDTIFLPGVVGTFEVDVQGLTAHFGTDFSSRPKSMKGYMKYLPVNGDSASIFCEVYRWNETLGNRVIIGRVEQFFYDSIEDWTEFNLPLVYNNDQTPDSVSVLFVSSAGYNFNDLFHCKGQLGSTLWVDDVEFVYDEGPAANETKSVLASAELYPNPSTSGVFGLRVPEACTVEVLSLAGQVVYNRNLACAGSYSLDLSTCARGVYLVRLTNAEGTAILKAVRP